MSVQAGVRGWAAGLRAPVGPVEEIRGVPIVRSFAPICARETPCKCCGAAASLYGLLDFNKNCEIYRNNALDIAGVPIYYHRCPECRFIFTTALDHFSKADFERYVYNEQYPLIDPDYKEARPPGITPKSSPGCSIKPRPPASLITAEATAHSPSSSSRRGSPM